MTPPIHVVIDRWQLAMDAAKRDIEFTATPAIVYASFDFDRARQHWWQERGDNDSDPEYERYALIEVR